MRNMLLVIAAVLAVALFFWWPGAAPDGRTWCPGRGRLDAAGMVRVWRATVLQQLTGRPMAPWCDETAGRKKCQRLRRWREPAAPKAQVALVREAFRLLEACAQERGNLHRCRQLLREDNRDACKVLNCNPYGLPIRPWFFTDSTIRAIVFARAPEGWTVDFRIYVDDAGAMPFLRAVAPGYARAFAARLHLYQDTLTGNHCPDARVDVRRP